MNKDSNVIPFNQKRVEKGIRGLAEYLTHVGAPKDFIKLIERAAADHFHLCDTAGDVSFAINARDFRGCFELRLGGMRKDGMVIPFGYISTTPVNIAIRATLCDREFLPITDHTIEREKMQEHLAWILRDDGKINEVFVFLTSVLRAAMKQAVTLYTIDEHTGNGAGSRHYLAQYTDATDEHEGEFLTLTFCQSGFDLNKACPDA